MAKGDAADRLRRMRQEPGFAPVWSVHAKNDRMPSYLDRYDLDKVSCERIVRTGTIGTSELNVKTGRDNVHVRGVVDGVTVDIVVDPQTIGGIEIALIVTVKPKARKHR